MVGAQVWSGSAVGAGELDDEAAQEAALLQAGRSGDDRALEQLLALHKRRLLALCHGMLGDPDDVEDAVQETFLRALRALPGFRGDATFRTWLFRIAVNVCLKRKASRPRAETWDDEQRPPPGSPVSPEMLALRRLRMREALASLSPRQRAVLLLRELEGWSVGEMALALGCSKKRIENDLYKARCALADWRRRMEEGGAR
jgi:RNA polymerase sigma-70 factor (ECF subfamily)